jgi:hypothetical protein
METAKNELRGKIQFNSLLQILVISSGQTSDTELGMRSELTKRKMKSNIEVFVLEKFGNK